MADHRSLHEALKVEEVGRHSSAALEYIVIKLQRSRTDVQYTLHARPQLRSFSGNLSQAELLHHLGFSVGDCPFTKDKCLARVIPQDFNVAEFARTIDRAFAELQEGIKLLFECGFYVEHRLFGREMPSLIATMLQTPRGDGHNAPQKKMTKQSEDATFDYRFTWIEGGADKGWTFHYRPKHPPLSQEMASLLAFLGLLQFPECPEYDFDPCSWRFCYFINTGHPVHGAAEIAHGWFDAHATKFSPGLQKVLDAHATLNTFGFDLLPRVRVNLPPEVVQPPKRKAASGAKASAVPSAFNLAVSFAGAQRDIAKAIAKGVADAGFAVFYDDFFPEQLWGKDLPVFFDEVFRTKSRYCLVVISKDYVERAWTNHERQSAVSRAIKERGREYILPLKVDDIDLPGVPDTIGYVSLSKYSVEQIIEMLILKLRG